MRMSRQTKELIESAARSVGKSFSAFLTDSARQHAIDVLLDQAVFNLAPEQMEAFAQVLENPPPATEKLKKLMRSKSPWES